MENTDIMQRILDKLESLESGQAKLEAGQAKLEAGQAKLEAGQAKLEAGQAELKQDVLEIKITLENDIDKKFGALFDGHKLNAQKLDDIKDVVDDIDASVSAMEVVTHFNNDEIIKMKIVK